MKMKFTIAVALLCPILLVAQPTITRDWIGTAGEEISSVFTLEVPETGDAGANRSWDFSNVTPDTIDLNFRYVNPDTTPYFNSYPASNSCFAVPEFGIYTYFELSNEAWDLLGLAFGMYQQIYQDPQRQLMFPMEYEDSFSDDFAYTGKSFGVTTFGTGTATVTADAYGTVTLPGGTYDDVMRIKVVEETEDSTDLGLGIVEKIISTTTNYIWYSASHPGPLCIRDYTESKQVALVPPLPPDTLVMDPDSSFQYDPSATNSAVKFFTSDAFELQVSPNPFVNNLNLDFRVDNGQAMKFELHTINGQVIYTQDLEAAPGHNNFGINIQGLATGPYIAVLKGENEGSLIRLVKVE